jgi:hypothetical protein
MCCMDQMQRFKSKYRIAPNDCWEWIAADDGQTHYGRVWFTAFGRVIKAHHASWLLFVGPIPKGKCICHRCDNPRCVNPTHLFAATHSQNMRDRHVKGRDASHKGELNGRAILTWPKVRKIRASKLSYPTLAAQYKVSMATIYAIRVGRLWPVK